MYFVFSLMFILITNISNAKLLKNENNSHWSLLRNFFSENCLFSECFIFFNDKKNDGKKEENQPFSIIKKSHSFSNFGFQLSHLDLSKNQAHKNRSSSFANNDQLKSNKDTKLLFNYNSSQKIKRPRNHHLDIIIDFIYEWLHPSSIQKLFQINQSCRKIPENIIRFCSEKPLSFPDRDLSDRNLSDNLISSIKNGCYACIKTLDLHYANFNPIKLEEVPETVKELSLYRSDYDIEFSKNFIDTIAKRFKNLEKLDLRKIKMTDDAIDKIISLPNLKELNLRDCGIKRRHIEKISQMTGITKLGLSENRLNDNSILPLFKNRSITKLDLSSNEITHKSSEELSQMSQITNLSLDQNKIGDIGAGHIASMKNLTDLKLSYNNINYEGAIAIARNHKITHLSLENNKIGDKGAIAIASIPRLVDLRLDENEINNLGVKSLSKVHSIKNLSLARNAIDDEGAIAIASMPNLIYLNLRFNKLTTNGIRALSKNHSLKKLEIEMNTLK
jgi:Leucine-rich repeat (LRR) protein